MRAEMDRLKGADPFAALGVHPTATSDTIRHAFLQATKQFHPNRYALETPEVRELATELFLLVRKAYDQLTDDAKRKNWQEKLKGTFAASPTTNPTIQRPPPGAVPSTSRPPQATTGPGAAIPGKPATNPPRAGTAPASSPTAARPTTTPPRPSASPAPSGPIIPGATGGPPAPRPPGAGNPAAKGITDSQSGLRAAAAAAAGKQIARARPPTRPPEEVHALLESAKTRNLRYDEGLRLFATGKYREAREVFVKIAAEDPQSRKYRVALHLAGGHEHRTENRLDEAQREFERAASLDPENKDVQEAQRKLAEQRKPTGILGKLFGR